MRDAEIDEIFDIIDELLLQGNYEAVNLMLKHLDLTIDLDLLLGYLTITLAAKTKLQDRQRVVKVVKLINANLVIGLE
jgi:hypothetical protein